MASCCVGGANHSADLVSVWHGESVPLVLCGFHASWDLSRVLREVRNV